VLTATRRALFELEEGNLPPGDPFLEYSKRLFRRIETKREDYKFLAEWAAGRQGVDEEGCMKFKYLSMEAKRDKLYRDHDEMTNRMQESPEGSLEKDILLMKAEVVAREYRSTLALIEMQQEIDDERTA